jgi:MYXO-CTERM domain-containing protein
MPCGQLPSRNRKVANRLGYCGTFVALGALLGATPCFGQGDRPRFVILLDNSTSMTQSLAGLETHGDGSSAHPGCDLDGKSTNGTAYDDSKLYLSKAAVIDTISAFGAAEFALAVYAQTTLGQPCATDSDCSATLSGATCALIPGGSTTQKYCAYHGGDTYTECAAGAGATCLNCANPTDTNDLMLEWQSFNCAGTCSYSQGCVGGQVIVGFPPAGTSNLSDIYRWIDGKEDVPPLSATSNREIRAVTMTPLASALDSVRGWLTDSSKTSIGPSAGLLSSTTSARDPRASCRPYSIILITDGEDTCSPNVATDPVAAAEAAYKAGINVYVMGFGVGSSNVLNNMAKAGSGQTRSAYFPSNRSDLTAALGDILINAIPKPKCTCDATCYDEAAAFPLKGKPCTVGEGRCKRQGVYTCNAAGDGVVCAATASCGATPLAPGQPVPEQCGTLAGCLAPTAADCADENCDGNIDEGLTCSCSSRPELCNGIDDNCDGVVDNIAQVACGLDLGACKPGVTTCVADGKGGQSVVCQGQVGPTAEVCDGLDNDCDGVVDQIARPCFPASTVGCTFDATANAWSCVGACKTGMQVCSAGTWQSCVGAVVPSTEIMCDGIDNNCDGHVDENNPPETQVCYPEGAAGCDMAAGKCVGQCSLGHWGCATNKSGLACVGASTPITELCNNKDDDCDGLVDEDFPTLGQPCNQQSCQGAGQLVCNADGTAVECTVSAAGPSPEVCDGRDNDCDGLVDEAPGPGEAAMPGVGSVCGSEVGECKQGVSACVGGKIVCTSVGPVAELCDGKDNDCNGSVDDGVSPPDSICNPDGIPAGKGIQGECKPGTFVCRGASGWRCQGGVGPTAEICDGKDNDCDGIIDNDALCAKGYTCIEGQCVPTCQEGGEQYPCPADRYCKDGACLIKACAVHPCAVGLVCQDDGSCVDPCTIHKCLEGQTCDRGVCTDCYSQGCPAGQECIGRVCKVNPCANKTCPSGQFCSAGECVRGCAGISCGAGQTCSKGACVKSACPATCELESFCDATTGTCQPMRCGGIGCPAGKVCVNATGQCTNDPCEQVRCGQDQKCVVLDDGNADCESPVVSGIASTARASGSGMFSCSVGSTGSTRAGATGLGLLLFAGLLLGRRRNRR